MPGAVDEERWERVTAYTAFRKREIEAFVEARAEICHLFTFWCSHIPRADQQRCNAQIDALYDRLLAVPMTGLLRERDGEDEINRDWYENAADEHNTKHKDRLLASWQAVWRDMVAMDAEAVTTWGLSGEARRQYEAIKTKTFAAVRAKLGLLSFRELRAREETARPGSGGVRGVHALLRELRSCAFENI
jgi:hypothetical protein